MEAGTPTIPELGEPRTTPVRLGVRAAPAATTVDDPVFVTEHPHRRVLVRAAVISGAVLLVAWLIALVLGALGFGTLPGLPFVGGGNQAPADSASAPRVPVPASIKAEPARPTAGDSAAAASSANGSEPASAPGHAAPDTGSGAASPGSGAPSSSPSGGSASPASPTTVAPTNGGSGGTGSSNGRGAPAEKPVGGRGAPSVNPAGHAPGGNAHGANPNAAASAAAAGGKGNGNGTGPPV